MSRKVKTLIVTLSAIVLVTAILIFNKSKMARAVEVDKYSAYPVTVITAKNSQISEQLKLVGTVEADIDIVLLSETDGKVVKMYAAAGDYAAKGSVIAQTDSELKAAALSAAETNFEKAKKDFLRYDNLFKNKNLSEADLENVKLNLKNAESQFIIARRQMTNTKITSPISGIITERYVNTGSTLAPGTPVVNIVDVSRLKIKLQIPEQDLRKAKNGDMVKVYCDLYPDEYFEGKISSISFKGDESHTFAAEVTLNNKKDKPLRAGMFVSVEFKPVVTNNSLTIPRACILGSLKEPKVFVVENGKAYLKELNISKEYEKDIIIRNGLTEGSLVVLNGQNNLSDGSLVEIKNK